MLKSKLTLLGLIGTLGCTEADTVSSNISKAADHFEINRRIVFYNGITGGYIMTIEGLCSIRDLPGDDQLEITCKTGPLNYKKHFLGLSDNVTYFAEQVESVKASPFRYRVIFRPSVIVPDIEVKTQ